MDRKLQRDTNDLLWRRRGGETGTNFVALETVAKEQTETNRDQKKSDCDGKQGDRRERGKLMLALLNTLKVMSDHKTELNIL